MNIRQSKRPVLNPSQDVILPFPLQIVQGKKLKKKCCKKYKKGKRCGRCPGQ